MGFAIKSNIGLTNSKTDSIHPPENIEIGVKHFVNKREDF
jgi:hypothetical protein